jgi:hypothetical protein
MPLKKSKTAKLKAAIAKRKKERDAKKGNLHKKRISKLS